MGSIVVQVIISAMADFFWMFTFATGLVVGGLGIPLGLSALGSILVGAGVMSLTKASAEMAMVMISEEDSGEPH